MDWETPRLTRTGRKACPPERQCGKIATSPLAATASDDQPTACANGRYEVKRFLGEGGKKRVYLAQTLGHLGSHPHIVTVFDLGKHPSAASARATRPTGTPREPGLACALAGPAGSCD